MATLFLIIVVHFLDLLVIVVGRFPCGAERHPRHLQRLLGVVSALIRVLFGEMVLVYLLALGGVFTLDRVRVVA